MTWNYRVIRHEQKIADNSETFYAIHEVYYAEDGRVKGWTSQPSGGPHGDTLGEMVRDLAWIIAGLSKPVLDAATGKEVEPAALLADDLAKMLGNEDGPDALEALGEVG